MSQSWASQDNVVNCLFVYPCHKKGWGGGGRGGLALRQRCPCVAGRHPVTTQPQHLGPGGGGDDALLHDPGQMDAASRRCRQGAAHSAALRLHRHRLRHHGESP